MRRLIAPARHDTRLVRIEVGPGYVSRASSLLFPNTHTVIVESGTLPPPETGDSQSDEDEYKKDKWKEFHGMIS